MRTIAMMILLGLLGASAQAAPSRAQRRAEMRQLPGVYKVAAQGGLCSNVFVLLTPEPVLIDAGSRPCWDQLVENLGVLGVKISDLRWVLGTHGHWDHVDNMARIARENSKARFAIHAGDAQFVINNDRVFSCAEPLYHGVASDPIRVDRILLDGDRIAVGRMSIRVIHAPGHTPGSVVFATQIAGKKVGFCADAVTGYYSMTNRSSVIDWEQSMKRLLAEDFDLLFTGHDKRPVEGKEKIAAYLNRSLAAAVVKRKSLSREEQYQDLVYAMEHPN